MKTKKVTIEGVKMTEFHIELYDQYFYLFFGKENYIKFLEAINEDEDVDKAESDLNSFGLVMSHESRKYPQCLYMWFPDNEYWRVERGTLAHEIIHLMDYVSINKGFKHDVKNQEVYAQLMGYLFKSLLPFFKKQISTSQKPKGKS